MKRLTLGQLKSSRIPLVLSLCGDDDRFIEIVNEVQQRLLDRGRWWGTIVRGQFCVRDGCITWPREVGTIEALAVCRTPIKLRNGWWEFVENMNTLAGCSDCDPCNDCEGLDRTAATMFSDIRGEDKVLRIYPTHAEDVGKTIIFHGYDANKVWIRTKIGDEWIDGEKVTLALPFVDTTSEFTSVTGVIKDETVARVLVYEHNTANDSDRAVAIYQWDETHPIYRRTYVPGLSKASCCGCNDEDDPPVTVNAIVKLAHVPVAQDNDWLVIQNLAALKLGCMSIKAEEDGEMVRAAMLWDGGRDPRTGQVVRGAIGELTQEARTKSGDRMTISIDVMGTASLNKHFAGFI